MIEISLIVPVYNKSYLTLDFLRFVSPYLEKNNAEIIIIDNGSIDNTSEIVNFCRNKYGDLIQYIKCEKNHGFGGGNNIGAERARGERLLFISNDVIVAGDFIKLLLDEMKNAGDKKIMFGARLIEFATGWNSFIELDSPIPYLEGWFIGITLENFRLLGKWSDLYFTDYDDLDLCYNAIQKGFELKEILQLNNIIHHIGGQTATTLDGGRLKYTLESRKNFCEKWGLTIKK